MKMEKYGFGALANITQKAIADYLGWRCPVCKHFVKPPDEFKKADIVWTNGECKHCGSKFIFEKVHLEKEEFKVQTEIKLPDKNGMDPVEVIEKYWDSLFSPEILENYFEGAFGDPLKIVPVNFVNKPIFFKMIAKYANENMITMSEAIMGFAAKGYAALFNLKMHCPICSEKMVFKYDEHFQNNIWKCEKCNKYWKELPKEEIQ